MKLPRNGELLPHDHFSFLNRFIGGCFIPEADVRTQVSRRSLVQLGRTRAQSVLCSRDNGQALIFDLDRAKSIVGLLPGLSYNCSDPFTYIPYPVSCEGRLCTRNSVGVWREVTLHSGRFKDAHQWKHLG